MNKLAMFELEEVYVRNGTYNAVKFIINYKLYLCIYLFTLFNVKAIYLLSSHLIFSMFLLLLKNS